MFIKSFLLFPERSEKKSFNLERAKKIAIGSKRKQCGRADVPVLECIMGLEECTWMRKK